MLIHWDVNTLNVYASYDSLGNSISNFGKTN